MPLEGLLCVRDPIASVLRDPSNVSPRIVVPFCIAYREPTSRASHAEGCLEQMRGIVAKESERGSALHPPPLFPDTGDKI